MTITVEKPTQEQYEAMRVRVAFSFAPRIYACKKCGWAVASGYCCNMCGSSNPSSAEPDE